jgi:N-acyl-D-amino-acid deacylase
MIRRFGIAGAVAMLLASAAPAQGPAYDVIISGGTIYDGSGGKPYVGAVAIKGGKIVAVGSRIRGEAKTTVDAKGLAVAPGFINMLSWATESLIADGRSMSDIKQGVTLEVFGEGWSMGPLNPKMKADAVKAQSDIKYDISWTTLGEYLNGLTAKGITPNVASYVGATTVRIHELGEGDVDPTPDQLKRMQALVRQAMNEGAFGVGSSLIYAPASFAETPELIALTKAGAACGGGYISHMRSEGDRLIEAVDELIAISRASGARAEIYHMKQGGKDNWGKLPQVIARVEAARKAGLKITANMYTYTAGATGLDAAMPLWVQAGGEEAWIARLKDPVVRAKVIAEMKAKGNGWENLYYSAGGADKLLFLSFKNPKLKPLTGKTLAEVAAMRGTSPEDTIVDLVIEDGSRVGTAYFLMDEANVAKQTALPWMSFGSDEASEAPEGAFLLSASHPRAYGTFARFLGKYARDGKTASLAEAVRRLSGFPASNLGLKDRGLLRAGYQADLAIFDPAKIADTATYANSKSYAVGMRHVFVNGVQVLKDGEHTGAKPGQVVRGPGWNKCPPITK